jgi:hypothetical protein
MVLPTSSASFSTRELRCHASLPFPTQFVVRPVVTNAFLSACGRHWLYSVLGVVFAVLCAMTTLFRTSMSPLWTGLVLGSVALCIVSWLLVTLTRMDRRLCMVLLRSFEWWFLMANVMAYVAAWLWQQASIGDVCSALLVPLACVYALSLDALVSSSRLGRGCVLAIMLLVFVNDYIALLRVEVDDSRRLPLSYTTSSVRKVTLHTLCMFLAKYLAVLLFRPHRLQIISTTIAVAIVDEFASSSSSDSSSASSCTDGDGDDSFCRTSSMNVKDTNLKVMSSSSSRRLQQLDEALLPVEQV